MTEHEAKEEAYFTIQENSMELINDFLNTWVSGSPSMMLNQFLLFLRERGVLKNCQ